MAEGGPQRDTAAVDRPDRTAPRTCVIIAGMHRSGTSALARVVNLLGADITKDLAPAERYVNERGFWESNAIYPIHDYLLERLGSSWHDALPLPDGWLDSDAAQGARAQIAGELDKDFSGSDLFVVKDPRLGRLLPLWLRILDDLAVAPVIVIPFRHPLEIAASLESRDGFSAAKSIALYVRSNLDVELASRGRARLFHPYEELLSNWRIFAGKLADIGGARLKTGAMERAGDIDQFLSDELRHHRFSRAELAIHPNVAATSVELYDLMLEAAVSDGAPLRPSFDRLREIVAEATRLYGALLSAGREGQLESRIAELQAALRQRSAENERMHNEALSLEGDLAQARRKAEQAADAYQAVLRSASWRLTAPLRTIKHAARRLVP